MRTSVQLPMTVPGNATARPCRQTVITRLDHELAIIAAMRFSSYFLVVRDIVGPVARTCGRGSGAASLVAYCLGITNVCPIRHNLYFERFLNPGRTDPPDIDIDFAWDERDRILASVLDRFGCQAAMVANHVGLQPRMAIRETAKVFGIPGGEISRITKKLPWIWRAGTAEDGYLEELQDLPQMRDADLSGPWPEILRLAARISGSAALPLGASRRGDHHPRSDERLCAGAAGRQGRADHPVGKGRGRGGGPGQDRSARQPQPRE